MKLTAIAIRNYKSVKELALRLGKFTVLVGRSDQGKSAIVQAIRDALTNPVGREMITKGRQEMAVGLIFDDGSSIRYTKEQAPGYRLRIRGKESVYDKVGRTVPQEVVVMARRWETEGVKPVLVCLQEQAEDPFLLGMSRAAGSRALDALDMKVFSEALTRCQSTLRKLSRDLNQVRQEEEDWRARKDALKEVPQLLNREKIARGRGEAILAVSAKVVSTKIPKEDLTMLRDWSIATMENVKLPRQPVGVADLLMVAVPTDLMLLPLDLSGVGKMLELVQSQGELEVVLAEKEEVESRLGVVTKELFSSGVCPLCGSVVKSGSCSCR